MTRPEKPIDWAKVDQLLMAGCKGTEICPHFDMHPTTFYRKVEEEHNMSFTEYSCIKREQGDSLLRAKQFEKALSKDNTMLIWLGKNRLDQRENYLDKSAAPPSDQEVSERLALYKKLADIQEYNMQLQEKLDALSKAT